MNVFQKSAQALKTVPYDYSAALTMPGWRTGLSWPVAQSDASAVLLRQLQDFVDLLGRLSDNGSRDAAILAGPLILARARALVLAAKGVQAEAATNIRFVGGPEELDYLRRNDSGGPLPASPLPDPDGQPIKHQFFRRTMRAATWSSISRLPLAVFAPRIVAVSHNPLLRGAAATGLAPVGFCHAETILATARAKSAFAVPAFDVDGLAVEMASILSNVEGLDDVYAERLSRLTHIVTHHYLAAAARDVAALRAFASLPHKLWSGTGGKYPARAVGLEVLRRGGEAVRFAHGGATGMIDAREALGLAEFAPSSEVVVPTKSAAEATNELNPGQLFSLFRKTEIVSHDQGDDLFKRIPRVTPRPVAARRKVIYAPTVLYGFRQLVPPLLPDLVYLDWQLRLAEMLRDMPIDLLCKPHPEGLLRGQPHPLAQVAPSTTALFEAVREDADAFVFDYSSTTTFWEALCTDRPVVFIDLSIERFSNTAKPMVERRCRIVTARIDSDNRPHVDPDELADAVMSGPDRYDPSEFRRVLGGDA